MTVGVANIARRQYIINTSLPGLVCNMARHCTRVQHFPSPTARENTCTHLCNISPYCPLNQVIRYIIISFILSLSALYSRKILANMWLYCAGTLIKYVHNRIKNFLSTLYCRKILANTWIYCVGTLIKYVHN